MSASKVKPKKRRSNRKGHSKTKVKYNLSKVLFNKVTLAASVIVSVLFIAYLTYLDFVIQDKMSGRIWSLPSYVYARPLELFQDKHISISDLQSELHDLNYQQVKHLPSKPGEYRYLNNSDFEFITRSFTFWDGAQSPKGLRLRIYNNKIQFIKELYSDQDIALFRLEPVKIAGIYPDKKEERQLVKLNELPDDLVLTLLAVEDRRFYSHWGLDPKSIARAFFANIKAGSTVQGGSTLTQQLIKNIFLSPDKTLVRKINEALMALLIELHYDKSVILETYINEVYLGQNGAKQIHGFELASQFYFAKTLKNLRRDQMALLVGLVKGPSWYEPRRHPDRATERRNHVLKIMHEQDIISTTQLEKYSSLSLDLAAKPRFSRNRYPALVDLVKRQLNQDYDENDLRSSGLNIFTSIDPTIQSKVESSVEKNMPYLDRSLQPESKVQVSVIVASSQQGEIQAMVSDRNPDFPGFNRSLDAVRQIGSLIKPAIYLAALQQANEYTLASMLDDSPLHIQTSKDQIWSPKNYDNEFSGALPLFSALEDSRNVPTVRLGLEVGLSDISDTLHNLGVTRDVPAYPSMTLGAFSLSPLDVANMYQTFAANGFHVPLKVIREVLNSKGEPLKRYPLESEKTLDEDAIYLVNYVLNRVTRSGTAKSLASSLPQYQFAGKTGTTDDLRDSWFAGFSDDQLAVVWLGHDDNSSTGHTGSSGALKLWDDIMRQQHINSLTLEKPNGVEMHWIDTETGRLSDKNCQGAVELPFIKNTAPIEKAECKTGGILYQIKRLFN